MACVVFSEFDLNKCVTSDMCYQYCQNAINEYKANSIVQTELYLNKTSESIDYMIDQQVGLVSMKTMIMIISSTVAGILLGLFIGLTILKKYPPQFTEVKKSIR